MNNEKLVDAIGLIDDNMICDAKKTHRSYSLSFKRAIAAILIITLIPVALFVGMSLFGRFLYAESSAPSSNFSFSTMELHSLCKTSFNAEVTPDIGVDPNSLNNHIGANPIEIQYADDMRIIFTTQNGIFEHFRFSYEYIESNYSLKKMGLPGFNQGDKTTLIEIDKYGENALLISSENMSQENADISYKNLNFVTGELTDIRKIDAITFDAYELQDNKYTYQNHEFVDSADWLSSNMAVCYTEKGDKLECFIRVPKNEDGGYIIGNAELVEVNENGSYKIYKLFK